MINKLSIKSKTEELSETPLVLLVWRIHCLAVICSKITEADYPREVNDAVVGDLFEQNYQSSALLEK